VDKLIENLKAVAGSSAVLSEPDELLVYECDGLPQHKYLPRAVVFPSSTEETAAVMRLLARDGVPFTPRGAGTGLSGGALSLNNGVVIELARMRKILKIDEANRIAVVQPGVVNSHVSRAVVHLGLHYVPDPSSQPTCTIGGNIAENAGGIHCLKYGTTTDHVLGIRVVLAGGEVVDLGSGGSEIAGYDLLGTFVGSEGTFGIATEATLRLVPIPPAVRTLLAEFAEVNDASHAVSAIIAAGVMPAALEMMDHEIIRAVEASVFAAGLPLDVGAALLIELDGIEAGLDEEAERVKSICLQYRARGCRLAYDDYERKKLWAARKGAFGAIGRISPDSMIQDAVVPRSQLPQVLASAYRIALKYQLRIANVFHAGDGNLHPLICFDSRSAVEVHNVKEAGRELMETCVRAGGSITGEHGVGFDKRELLSLIFSEADMDAMLRVRAAFDPTGLCNPGKIIPMLRGCGEARATSNVQRPMSNVLSDQEAVAPEVQAAFSFRRQTSNILSASRGVAPASSISDPESAHQQLAQLIGEGNISASSRLPFSPSARTVSPGSIAEVCEIMKLATSEGWAVVPAGAMTWLDVGQPMKHVRLVISMRRLNRIIEHEPADLIAVTEAGVTLDTFNCALAEKGQWLPLDPPNDGRTTIGGVVATGLGGPQQFGYGAPRRHVIGMKVVLADGTLIKVGGRVVKNVAGYDLCKLFTGSYGTLGTIVEVNFKLRPLPFATSSLLVAGEREELLRIARQIIHSRLFPVAVELLSPAMARVAELTEKKQHMLLLKFDGSSTAVQQQVARAREMTSNCEQSLTVAEDHHCWRRLEALPSQFAKDLIWRVGLSPVDISDFVATLDEQSSGGETSALMWQAGVGDGRIRVIEQLQQKGETDETGRHAVKRLEQFRSEAERRGGTLTVEYAANELKTEISTWGNFGSAAGIMDRIKQQLDPHAILSPGRFGFEDYANDPN
jgi:glycolate oxidase subunit GlcD